MSQPFLPHLSPFSSEHVYSMLSSSFSNASLFQNRSSDLVLFEGFPAPSLISASKDHSCFRRPDGSAGSSLVLPSSFSAQFSSALRFLSSVHFFFEVSEDEQDPFFFDAISDLLPLGVDDNHSKDLFSPYFLSAFSVASKLSSSLDGSSESPFSFYSFFDPAPSLDEFSDSLHLLHRAFLFASSSGSFFAPPFPYTAAPSFPAYRVSFDDFSQSLSSSSFLSFFPVFAALERFLLFSPPFSSSDGLDPAYVQQLASLGVCVSDFHVEFSSNFLQGLFRFASQVYTHLYRSLLRSDVFLDRVSSVYVSRFLSKNYSFLHGLFTLFVDRVALQGVFPASVSSPALSSSLISGLPKFLAQVPVSLFGKLTPMLLLSPSKQDLEAAADSLFYSVRRHVSSSNSVSHSCATVLSSLYAWFLQVVSFSAFLQVEFRSVAAASSQCLIFERSLLSVLDYRKKPVSSSFSGFVGSLPVLSSTFLSDLRSLFLQEGSTTQLSFKQLSSSKVFNQALLPTLDPAFSKLASKFCPVEFFDPSLLADPLLFRTSCLFFEQFSEGFSCSHESSVSASGIQSFHDALDAALKL